MNPALPNESEPVLESRKSLRVVLGILLEPPSHPPSADGLRILISRRQPDTVLGGYWEFPGGKIEPGETPPQALQRELHEELGVTIQVLAPPEKHALPVIEYAYPHALVQLIPLWCRLISGQPQPIESAQCRWIAPAELPDYRFPPANASLLPRIQQSAPHVAPLP